jgi:hypothetical protein
MVWIGTAFGTPPGLDLPLRRTAVLVAEALREVAVGAAWARAAEDFGAVGFFSTSWPLLPLPLPLSAEVPRSRCVKANTASASSSDTLGFAAEWWLIVMVVSFVSGFALLMWGNAVHKIEAEPAVRDAPWDRCFGPGSTSVPLVLFNLKNIQAQLRSYTRRRSWVHTCRAKLSR